AERRGVSPNHFRAGGPAMRPRSPCPRPWVVPLGLLLAVIRCGDVAGPGGYTVTYRASLARIATIDSIYYDNGSGKCASNCSAERRGVSPNHFRAGGPAMRPRSPCPRPWVVPLGLLLAVIRCGDVAGPGGYTVTYRASLARIATIDSIYYDNGSGKCASNCTGDSTLQRVVA